MKKIINCFLALSISGGILLTSCKKNDEDLTPNSSVSDSEVTVGGTQSSDNADLSTNIDKAMDDANDVVNSAGARIEACAYSSGTVTGVKSGKSFKLNYSGTACDGITRSGSIAVSLIKGDAYKDINAVWQIVFDGYAVTTEGKTMTINGTHTVTNTTGGMPVNIFLGAASVTHKVRGEMIIKFDTTALTRIWQIAHKRTWTNVGGVLGYKIEGDTTILSYEKTSNWGVNRFGNAFYTQITTPVAVDTKCGFNKPTSGVRKHTLLRPLLGDITTTETITFDKEKCTGTYNIEISKNGKTRSASFEY